jgi:hypothetical protein
LAMFVTYVLASDPPERSLDLRKADGLSELVVSNADKGAEPLVP